MARPRAFLIALTLLAMALAPLLGPTIGRKGADGHLAFAAPAWALASDNDDGGNGNGNSNSNSNNNNSNSNNSNSNNNNSNSNGNGNNNNNNSNDNNSNDNSNSNGNSNGNGNDNSGQSAGPSAPPPPPAAPACSTPGQESTFQSSDGRVQVKVFASMAQSVRFSIRLPVDQASVPPAPGQVVDALRFQLIAESCNGAPIAVLQSEVNLGVHYSDSDASGLNEANFTLARLDTNTNQWQPSAKQVTDPGSNFTSATITDMGFYVLYQHS